MPGDVTQFTSVFKNVLILFFNDLVQLKPERSIWHQDVKRCSGFVMEKIAYKLLNPMWGTVLNFSTDLGGYNLLAAASLRLELEPLSASWNSGGSIARTVKEYQSSIFKTFF